MSIFNFTRRLARNQLMPKNTRWIQSQGFLLLEASFSALILGVLILFGSLFMGLVIKWQAESIRRLKAISIGRSTLEWLISGAEMDKKMQNYEFLINIKKKRLALGKIDDPYHCIQKRNLAFFETLVEIEWQNVFGKKDTIRLCTFLKK